MALFQVSFTSITFTPPYLFPLFLGLAQGVPKAPSDPSITLNTTSGTNDTLTFYNDPNDSIDNDQLQVTFVYYASYLLNQDEVYINFFGSLAFLSTYPYLGHFHEIIVPVREGGTIFGSFIPDDRLQPKLTPRACIFAIWRASTYFLERPGLLHPFVATIKDGERVLGEWSIGVRGRTIMSPSSMSVPPMVPPIETTAASGAVIPVSQASVTAAASSDIISLRDIDPKAVENSTSLDFVPASLGQYEWTIIRLAPSIQPLSILMTFIQVLVHILPYGRQRTVSGLTVHSMYYRIDLKFIRLAVLQFERDAGLAAIAQMLKYALRTHVWGEMDALLGYGGNVLLKVTLRRRGDAE